MAIKSTLKNKFEKIYLQKNISYIVKPKKGKGF